MASQKLHSTSGRRAGILAGPTTSADGTDLVIIVLNEHANAGVAIGCQASFCDYAATIPPASAV